MARIAELITAPLVLDTSVIVKWFRQEEVLAQQALNVRDRYLRGDFSVAVPTLVAYELANVLAFKTDLSTVQVQEAVQSIFDIKLEWVVPSKSLVRRAVEISRTYATTVYDATFIAIAEERAGILITADERLSRKLLTFSFVKFLGQI
ncbi:MAG: PIN domain-containing protein [Chloroflexi bacterium]|nr:PIN domain-containing protein [Chloroflexota bacterium]